MKESNVLIIYESDLKTPELGYSSLNLKDCAFKRVAYESIVIFRGEVVKDRGCITGATFPVMPNAANHRQIGAT